MRKKGLGTAVFKRSNDIIKKKDFFQVAATCNNLLFYIFFFTETSTYLTMNPAS